MWKVPTSRLYYDDCYTSLFKAELLELTPVAERTGVWCAYLDRTFFYPTSGGQPHDLGSIGDFAVADVIDEGDRIAHLLKGVDTPPLLVASGLVEGLVDWRRRYDHMQQHTGQHLLSAVFAELLNFKTLSFHMGEDVSSIEIATEKLDDSQIDLVERRANELVADARSVRISYEEADDAAGLRKAPARTGSLRIVTIEAYNRTACGGTHVLSTAEIGPVQIRNLERVRGNIRLEFVCGVRALRRSKQDFRILSKLAKMASVQPLGLAKHVSGLRQRLETADKALFKANLLLAQNEGQRLYEQTSLLPDGTRRRFLRVSELTDSVRSTAMAFASHSGAVIAILPESLPGPALLASSADSGVHPGNLWRTAFASGGGRGGGSGTLAQGHVTDSDALGQFLRLAGLTVEF